MGDAMPNPTLFSIIIPTFNHLDRLAEHLASIKHLNYPISQLEVIVVDDGVGFFQESAKQKLKPIIYGRTKGGK